MRLAVAVAGEVVAAGTTDTFQVCCRVERARGAWGAGKGLGVRGGDDRHLSGALTEGGIKGVMRDRRKQQGPKVRPKRVEAG